MKLKFINCLVAVALLGGSAQILTSCKDTNEDEWAKVQDQYLTLQQKHDKDVATLNGLIDNLNGKLGTLESNLNTELNNLKGEIAALKDASANHVTKAEFQAHVDEYLNHLADFNALKGVVDDLKATVDGLNSKVTTLEEKYVAVETALAAAQVELGKLGDRVDGVEAFVNEWKAALGENTTVQDVVDAVATANKNKADIEAINTTIDEIKKALSEITSCSCDVEAIRQALTDLEGRVLQLEDAVKDLNGAVGDLNDAVDGVKKDLAATAEALRNEAAQNLETVRGELAAAITAVTGGSDTTIAQIEDMLNGLDIAIGNVTNRVQILENALDALMGRLDNRITSVVLQGTWNSAFGYLNLPVGIQSNMLVGMAGHNGYPHVSFPSTKPTNTYNLQAPVITESDLFILKNQCGFEPVQFGQGELLANTITVDGTEYVSLGKIYFTANPGNINLEGKKFALENSLGQASVATLVNVTPSDKLLEFGYGRSVENGFYEADVVVLADDAALNQARFTIDENFKDDVLAQLKQVTTARGIVGLASQLYNQFNGFLPALGLSAAWEENGNMFKVVSNYGVGAVVYQPLSFRFLNGTSLRTIPAIPNISDNINIDFGNNTTEIDFNELMVLNGGGLDIEAPLHIVLAITVDDINVRIEGYPVIDGEGNKTGETTLEFTSANLSALSAMFRATLMAQIPADATASVHDGIVDGVNTLMDKIDAQIAENENSVRIVQDFNQTLLDIQADINGQIEDVADKISKFTNKIQKLINRINRVLQDPTHYLQPALYFHAGDTYGIISNSKAFPSTFVLDGGNSVTLVPTTYTAEAIAPAYKKFVAVTNVYLTSDMRHTAKGLDEEWGPDAKCLALLKQANAQQYMCEVINGERRTIPFLFEGASGYTFEILYTAIDFQGCASSQKFYVTVK